MQRQVDVNSKDHASDVLAKFNSFRKDNKYCDFVIKAGKKGVPVHRCVVAAGSEYFDGMLSHDTKESREGAVEIKEADPESVVKCIEFLYTGKAEVSDEKQGDLLHVAHMLRLHRLYNGIALFLEEQLNSESFFSTREVANLYDCSRLVEVCNEFALKNFRAIAKMEDFKQIEAKYLDFLLTSERLKESDRTKCKALMVWINHDSSRAASLFCMMKHIEFTNVPLSYRRFLMDREPAFSESIECLKLLMKSILDGEKVTASDASFDPGIIVFDNTSKRMQCLDTENGIWTEMQEINDQMVANQCSIAVLDDFIYAFLANRATYRIKYIECHAKWETIAQRSGNLGCAVALKEYIYVTDNGAYTNQIQRYSPSENQWSFTNNRSITARYSAVASTEGCLFLFGGQNSSNVPLANVQKYDPASNTWSDIGNLGQARYQASATALDDVVYVFGGCNPNALSNFEIFRPKSNTAELVTLPNFSRQNFNSLTLDGIIYLVGGNSGTRTIDAYNPRTKALTTVMTLSDIKMHPLASVIALT